jgi:hypothetical protein
MAPRALQFGEGVFFVAGGETTFDRLLPTRLSSKVTTAGRREGADPTAAVTTPDLETDGGDVPLGPILVAERLAAPAAGPRLGIVVEVGLGLTTGLVARRAGRGGCRR